MASTDVRQGLTSAAQLQPPEGQAVKTTTPESYSHDYICLGVASAATGGARRRSTSATAGLGGSRLQTSSIPPPDIRVVPGERGSGYMATAELRALFPVPPSVVFSLLTHPDKEMAFRNILEVCDRVELTGLAGSGSGDPRVRVFEETQVGETSILWHHSKFRNRVRLEEDASDPRVMVQRFKLLHGDTLSRFEGSWVVSAAKAPQQEGAEAAADEDELQLIDGGGGGGEESGDESIEDDVVEVGAAAAAAAGASIGRGSGEGLVDVDTPPTHVEDGWEDIGGLMRSTAAVAPTVVPGAAAGKGTGRLGLDSSSVEPPQPAVEPPLPAVEAPQPAVVPPQPAVEPPQPAVVPPQPAVEPPLPAVDPSQPGDGVSDCTASSTATTAGTEPSLRIQLTPTELSGPAAAASTSDSVGRGSSGCGDSGGWCLVVLKHGLSPKGVPALVRPAVGRMVRAATEASLCRLHEDLKDMLNKVLQGATVDEAVAAVRDEHRAHHQHGRRHHRAKENPVRQHVQNEQQQQGKKGKQKQVPSPPPPPPSPPPHYHLHQQQLPAAAATGEDTGSGVSVVDVTTSRAVLTEPCDVGVGSASVMAGSEVLVGKQPLVRNPVTGELVYHWVP